MLTSAVAHSRAEAAAVVFSMRRGENLSGATGQWQGRRVKNFLGFWKRLEAVLVGMGSKD